MKNIGSKVLSVLKTGIENRANNAIITPINTIVDQNLTDITTTIGSFIVRSIRGKFQRSISFNIGAKYSDRWMEEALYGILYQYNDIKGSSRLELTNKVGVNDGSAMYYRLDDGTHNLKYRNYNILLCIQTISQTSMAARSPKEKLYTIITYDLSPEFVTYFERDMINHRNSLLKIRKDSPTVNVYQDCHESDGYTYWDKTGTVSKRRISTVYLPYEVKKKLVDTINNFFAAKEFYTKNGIAHNLKILLYGPPGPQPVSIMIPTPYGMKRFGDLEIGDTVFDHEGKPTNVTEIYHKGIQDVYEVRLQNGRKTKCTADHLWKVLYRSHREWKEDVVPLQHILDTSDLVDLDNGNKLVKSEKEWSIQTNGAAQFKERLIHIDPYVMGILITNGCLTDEYLRISQPTSEVPDSVAFIAGIDVTRGSDDDEDYSYDFYHKNGERIKTSEFLSAYPELVNTKSPNRTIPEDYLFNTVENRLALLNGLMDGDGFIAIEGRPDMIWPSLMIRFTTTSVRLSEQFVWLCRSLGFDCSILIDCKEKYTSGYCAGISIPAIDDIVKLFRVSYKQEVATRILESFYELKYDWMIKWNEHHDKSKISSVKKLPYQEEVMCIKVANPEHLYLTEDFMVTHNTGKDTIAKMIASEWNRNIYYITGGKDGRFVPNAITDNDEDVNYPLMMISDIDKYPFLINEADLDLKKDANGPRLETMGFKQAFGSMINALDGVVSSEDRIIIMTTNHIDKFSDTFLRPGRIDLMLEIGYVTPEVFRQYVFKNYNIELPKDIELADDQLTVGKLQFDTMFVKPSAEEFINKYLKKKKGGTNK